MNSVSRRTFLEAGAAMALMTAAPGLVASRPKQLPNTVWSVSEDNYPLIGPYGDKLVRTPP